MTAVEPHDQNPSADVLALAFQMSTDCIKVLDRDGVLLMMNAGGVAAMELCGPSDLVGQRWAEFWSGSERDAAIGAIDAARCGKTSEVAGFLKTAKGAPKWWSSTVHPAFDTAGEVNRILVISRDVSRQKQLSSELSVSQSRTRGIVLATSEIVWHTDAQQAKGDVVGLSDFTGADTQDRRYGWLAQIHPEDVERVDSVCRAGIASQTDYVSEYRLHHHSGTHRWVEDRAVALRNEAGQVLEWVGVITDIHDRVIATQNLQESEERLRLAVKASHVGIWDVDLATGRRRWSDEIKTIFGLPLDTEESDKVLLSLVHPDDRPAILSAHADPHRESRSLSYRIRRADTGEERWVFSQGQAVRDANGHIYRRLGTLQDTTERKRAEQQLWMSAHHDPLTLLPNRALFRATLETAVIRARAKGSRIALMLLDLDHFKEINDTLGHEAGDAVLCVMAGRLRDACEPSSMIARLGGDEFAILVQDAGSIDHIGAQAQRLVQDLSGPSMASKTAMLCSASLGLAIFPDHDPDAGELLKNADVALYAAKHSGRARHAMFEPEMKTVVQRRVTVLQRARAALAEGDIMPYYQPKVALNGRATGGFEALLRWTDGTTVRSPGELMQAFEDPDLAAQIGERMLGLVIADLLGWRTAGLLIGSVALNVAAAEFLKVDVAARWLSALQDAGLPADCLQMEVTESVFLGEGSDAVGRSLSTLHRSGIAIALDDFGTGFASLTHLRQYPVDWLKIDQSFIRDLEKDGGARAIVASVIGLAHGLGLRVVAEGVETQAQATMLKDHRCDLAQGYLVARPMPASQVPQFLGTWRGLDVVDRPQRPVAPERRAVSGSRAGDALTRA